MARSSPDDANVMTPLGELLRSRMDEKRWKLQDVVRPPDGKRQGGPARSTLSYYLQPGTWLQTMPRPKAIKELATAVQVSEASIQDAAYRSLKANRGNADDKPQAPVGANVPPEILAELADLSPEQIAEVRGFLQGIKAR